MPARPAYLRLHVFVIARQDYVGFRAYIGWAARAHARGVADSLASSLPFLPLARWCGFLHHCRHVFVLFFACRLVLVWLFVVLLLFCVCRLRFI